MDSDRNFIPVVEGDQGEGYKDLLDFDEWPEKEKKAYKQALLRAERAQQAILAKMINKK